MDTITTVPDAEEEMFENSNYNTAAQNLNEIELTPPDDYSPSLTTIWDNLPIRARSMREMKISCVHLKVPDTPLDMPTRTTIVVRYTTNQ